MRTSMLIILAGLTLGSPLALAQTDEDHSAHNPPASDQAPPKADEGDAAPPAHEHGTAKASPVGENMQKVEALMQQIAQATDSDQKRTLLHEHLQALREQVKLMRSQAAGMKMAMKGGDKSDAGAKQKGMMGEGGMMGGGMMGMHKKVEQRLDMIERVLQQLIEHEGAEADLEGR